MAIPAPAPKPNDYGPESVPRAATWRRRHLEDLTPGQLERLYAWLRDFDDGTIRFSRAPELEALIATVYREICRRPAAVR